MSLPGQIVNTETNTLAASELPLSENVEPTGVENPMSIPENQEECHQFQAPVAAIKNVLGE